MSVIDYLSWVLAGQVNIPTNGTAVQNISRELTLEAQQTIGVCIETQ